MKSIKKLGVTLIVATMVSASFAGFAMAHNGKKGGPPGFGGHGGKGAPCEMDKASGKGGHHKMGGRGGMNFGMMVHQQKYVSLLVNAYAPNLKSEWENFFKAEKELQTNRDTFFKGVSKPIKRIQLPKPDQAFLDSKKAALDAMNTSMKSLYDAIVAEKSEDIASSLKSLLDARKQMLVLEAKEFEALKTAISQQKNSTNSGTQTTPNSSSTPSGTGTSSLFKTYDVNNILQET